METSHDRGVAPGRPFYSKTLENFDRLPDSARVALPVVCALFSISPATAWRRVKSGLLPPTVKEGGSTRWVVGELRRALAR